MKKTLVLVVSSLLVFPSLALGKNTPTEEETKKWIKQKIETKSGGEYKTDYTYRKQKDFEVSYQDCYVLIKFRVDTYLKGSLDLSNKVVKQFRFPLAYYKEITKNKKYNTIKIFSEINDVRVKRKSIEGDPVRSYLKGGKSNAVDDILLGRNLEDIAPRLHEAFSHLKNIKKDACGVKNVF